VKDEGWMRGEEGETNFQLLVKVFIITESSGHFLFVSPKFIPRVGWWVVEGVEGGGVSFPNYKFHLVGLEEGCIPKFRVLDFLKVPFFGEVVIVILIVTGGKQSQLLVM
jgi:hypothetical protein